MRKNEKGFTLIELLVVIAIIGLLATLAIVSLRNAQQRARDTKRITDVKSIQTAVELYASENSNAYPSAATWAALETALEPYITNLPVDPTNSGASARYVYASNGADQYVIATTLEDPDQQALDQDSDASEIVAPVSGVVVFAVSAGSAPADDAKIDCADADRVYCLVE
ncbi:MAG: hypothetical protein A3F54_00665 [Candidatus Kerfeldbacteria bacterium RIFCSPHIGHO2_12_FULL_48_17]|uniref:Type II secretion system protein GspG C-terminal domain-containing protein n=1 Tax=Candidatus Kerfeldbacteria bacterium RIFCSPHIGHO2_12_FULL_48_17 TaxID=1798542 RepID=A0A1G2B6W8_9BACT|nr:MAG: hypothetical protein A3F54_00665 [Candidatus Kerfeldbacteria bacterium RIFCSPHIGHO2_12_FULL_48_17]